MQGSRLEVLVIVLALLQIAAAFYLDNTVYAVLSLVAGCWLLFEAKEVTEYIKQSFED